jgi:hypothetical protein
MYLTTATKNTASSPSHLSYLTNPKGKSSQEVGSTTQKPFPSSIASPKNLSAYFFSGRFLSTKHHIRGVSLLLNHKYSAKCSSRPVTKNSPKLRNGIPRGYPLPQYSDTGLCASRQIPQRLPHQNYKHGAKYITLGEALSGGTTTILNSLGSPLDSRCW